MPGGRLSILRDDQYQRSPHTDSSDDEIASLSFQFIDDDYEDQLELSLSPPLLERRIIYPSAASFPDLDIGKPCTSPFRERTYSYSDPEIPQTGCHGLIQTRWRRLTAAVGAGSTGYIHLISTMENNLEVEEEQRAATLL